MIDQSFASGQTADGNADVFWVDGPFVYRLSAGRVEGDTHFAGDATALLPDLRLPDLRLAVRKPRLLAGWGVVAFGFWAFLATAPAVTIALATGLVAVWWWRWRGLQQEPKQPGGNQTTTDGKNLFRVDSP